MGVDLAQANLRFLQAILDDPDWAQEEQRRMQEHNTAEGGIYADKVLASTLNPKVITPEQRNVLETASRHLMGALDTLVDTFVEDDGQAVPWEIDEELWRLFATDPGYEGPIPVARFDGFLQANGLRILEFNTDSPAGPGYGDVVQTGLEAMVERNPHLGEGLVLPGERRVPALCDTLLECYHAWRGQAEGQHPSKPRIAIADWRDVDSRADMDLIADRLQARGLDASFADPRDLALDGDRLVHDGEPVHLVYKRVIVDELVEDPNARALAHAYEAGTVCMANPPRSVLAGDKRAMALLATEPFQQRLTAPQRAAVDQFLPWTRILEAGKTTIEGYTVNTRDFVLDNKDRLVLKAAVSYGGQDVVMGPSVDDESWGSLVDEHIKTGRWVVQELVGVPKGIFPRIDEEGVNLQTLNVNVNPFVFGGAYGGSYTRVSAEDVINVAAAGGLAATVTLDPGGR